MECPGDIQTERRGIVAQVLNPREPSARLLAIPRGRTIGYVFIHGVRRRVGIGRTEVLSYCYWRSIVAWPLTLGLAGARTERGVHDGSTRLGLK